MIAWQPVLEEDPPPAKFSLGRFVGELPVLFAVAAVVAFLLKSVVAQAFYIPSGSMVPQLEVNDRVIVSKLAYRLHEPRRGDIVVFECPPRAVCRTTPPDQNPIPRFVKAAGRAVGLVQPSTEDFIKRVIALPGETVEGKEGHVYVQGRLLIEPYLPDGTPTSDFAPITVPPDRLWVMGDNRPNSSDSRVFGPIEKDLVIGRATLKVWPPGAASFL